jgi:hypothetical protein
VRQAGERQRARSHLAVLLAAVPGGGAPGEERLNVAYLLDPSVEYWDAFVADLESIPNWRQYGLIPLCCGADCKPHICDKTDAIVQAVRNRDRTIIWKDKAREI